MQDTLTRYLTAISEVDDRQALRSVLSPLFDRYSSQMLLNSTLVITATAGLFVPKTGAVISYGTVQGKPFTIAAGTDMPSLGATNVLAADAKNICCFFQDAGGTRTSAWGVAALTTAGVGAVKFPPFPVGKTLIGFVIVTTVAVTFTPDTDALNAAGVTTVYISPTGPFDPTVLI